MLSSYDDIAGLYDNFWSDWYLPAALPALERLFFSRVNTGARVLDLCCGSGHVTKDLVRRGFKVTGVDQSAALIDIAQKRLPGADFQVQDIQQLTIPGTFDAVLSTFDSLNHILSLQGLRQAFVQVHQRLEQGGRFVFDMNLAQAYLMDLSEWEVMLDDHSVGLVRGKYDPAQKLARTELVWFVQEGQSDTWRRKNSVVEQRCYEPEEITGTLRDAGFGSVELITAEQAGMRADLGLGRIFFVAIR